MSKQIDVGKELITIKGTMPHLVFPIANAQSLVKQLQGKSFTEPFTGKPIAAADGIQHVPAKAFPILSQQDFDSKVSGLIATRAIRVGVQPLNFKP